VRPPWESASAFRCAIERREGSRLGVHRLPGKNGCVERVAVRSEEISEVTSTRAGERKTSEAIVPSRFETRRGRTSHPERRMKLLNRPRDDDPRRNRDILTLVSREPPTFPEPRDQLDGLLHHGPRFSGVDPEATQFLDGNRPSETELDPAAGQNIKRSDPLSHLCRMIEGRRGKHHAVTDSYARRVLRCRSQKDLGGRRARQIFKEVMFYQPYIVEADPFRRTQSVRAPPNTRRIQYARAPAPQSEAQVRK